MLSLLLGCDPPPKSIGDDILGTPDPHAPEWSHVLPAETFVFGIAATPDGGVAAIEHRYEPYEQRVVRYGADGGVLWQADVGSFWLNSIAVLPEGHVVVGGGTSGANEGSVHATLWRLSPAGTVDATYVHPSVDPEGAHAIEHLAVSGTGVAYVVSGGEVGRVDLDLVPQWSWTGFAGSVESLGVLPSGEVVTLEQHSWQEGTALLRTFTPAGLLANEEVVPRGRFAADEPLLRTEELDDGSLRLSAVGGTSTIDLTLAGDPPAAARRVAHGHGMVAVVGPEDAGTVMTVLQLDENGAELRALSRPPLAKDTVVPLDVAIAPDGSIYVSGHENVLVSETDPPIGHGFLLKLPPP